MINDITEWAKEIAREWEESRWYADMKKLVNEVKHYYREVVHYVEHIIHTVRNEAKYYYQPITSEVQKLYRYLSERHGETFETIKRSKLFMFN